MAVLISALCFPFSAFPQPAPHPISPKVWGAGVAVKGAQKQVASVAALVPVAPRTITFEWKDPINPPGTTYNVYHALTARGQMTLLTNTAGLRITLPANLPQEYFDVKSLGTNGVESGFSGK